MARESAVEPNRSAPSSCRAKLISVSETERAFFENQMVMTMISPPMKRISGLAATAPSKALIFRVEMSTPFAAASDAML